MNIYHRLESGPFNQTQVSQCCSSVLGLDTRGLQSSPASTATALGPWRGTGIRCWYIIQFPSCAIQPLLPNKYVKLRLLFPEDRTSFASSRSVQISGGQKITGARLQAANLVAMISRNRTMLGPICGLNIDLWLPWYCQKSYCMFSPFCVSNAAFSVCLWRSVILHLELNLFFYTCWM